ncbi:MAG: SDR family oxidoreductase [Planctomycetota bacterium]|nr:SDR family oxidoreductase [Planctomycetota bacterium]
MQTTSRELSGKTAVVTGSSSGIGRAIAIELASAGAKVMVHARESKAAAEAVVAELQAAELQAAELQMADLGDPAGQDTLVERAWERFGHVDIWVNNAGADILTGRAADDTFEAKLESLWRVDVMATVRLSRMAGCRMKEQARGGAIINVGWDGSGRGMAGDTGELFATSKSAIEGFSRSLAASLAPRVRVNCLAPGWIHTAWGRQASKYWQDRARGESLLDRWGQAEDVARAARFLAGPGAAFINAQTLSVNGGFKFS